MDLTISEGKHNTNSICCFFPIKKVLKEDGTYKSGETDFSKQSNDKTKARIKS